MLALSSSNFDIAFKELNRYRWVWMRYAFNFKLFSFTELMHSELVKLELVFRGLSSYYKENKVVWWEEDYQKFDKSAAFLKKIIRLLPKGLPEKYNWVKESFTSIENSLEEVRKLAINGELLDSTQYITLFPSTTERLKKSIQEVEEGKITFVDFPLK